MQLGISGLSIIYILSCIFVYVYTLRSQKNFKDEGRFKGVNDTYRQEAYREFIDKCRERIKDNEVVYFSIDDIDTIVDELKEGI